VRKIGGVGSGLGFLVHDLLMHRLAGKENGKRRPNLARFALGGEMARVIPPMTWNSGSRSP
jgi:hypothetical protein